MRRGIRFAGEARPGHNYYNIIRRVGRGMPARSSCFFEDDPCHHCIAGSPAGSDSGITSRGTGIGSTPVFDRTIRSTAGQASLAAASLSRALPALDRLPLDDRRWHSSGASMATLLKLIPPAATKAVIDYVILAHPVAGRARGVESRFAAGITEGTPGRPWWAWSSSSRCWASSLGSRAAGKPPG